MVLAFTRGAGPLVGVGIGVVVTGASLLWPTATGPLFFYGGLGLVGAGAHLKHESGPDDGDEASRRHRLLPVRHARSHPSRHLPPANAVPRTRPDPGRAGGQMARDVHGRRPRTRLRDGVLDYRELLSARP